MSNIEPTLSTPLSDGEAPRTEWDTLVDEVPFPGDASEATEPKSNQEIESENVSNAGKPWKGFPDEYDGVDESEPDIDGVPQTMWRGERYYLDNIDELGRRNLSTKGHEATHNRDGKVYTARDKKYASLYAVGTDGVKFYDGPLPIEQIPIGVIFKINNSGNHLHSTPTAESPDTWGPFAGRFREFVSEEIPTEDCEVVEIYLMDDFIADDTRPFGKRGEGFSKYKTGGHVRSDARRPTEVYRPKNQSELPEIIDKVKKRMIELDEARKK